MGSVSGGVRTDFSRRRHGITVPEERPLSWLVTGPDAAPVEDFTGWEVDLFLFRTLRPGTLAEYAERATLHLSETDGLTLAEPHVVWPISAAHWAALSPTVAEWWYRLWRTDDPNQIAWGRIGIAR